MEVITSSSNKKFQRYKSLKQKKYREKYGLFMAEGYKLTKEALDSDFMLEDIIVSESSDYLDEFSAYMVLADELFFDLTDMQNPEGVIAIVKMKDFTMEGLADNLFCLDRISDPGNLGTIIRSADSFAFADLLLMPGCVDPYNPKVVRASMGSIFRVAIHQVKEDNILELKAKGYELVSSSLEGSLPIKDLDLPKKFILTIGSESHGIGDFFIKNSDSFVKIPMTDKVDSLNAAIAASIFMYELTSL